MLYDIAQIILILVLTFYFSYSIIRYNAKIRSRGIKMVLKSQSAIHNKIKHFGPEPVKTDPISQSKIHVQKHMLKVMIIDGSAYWVKDNIFFVADTDNGIVLHNTAQQVDTVNMSKPEIDKMMFILDKLKEL